MERFRQIKKYFYDQEIFFFNRFFLFNQAVLNAVTYNSEPQIFVEELVQDAIKTLSDKSIPEEEKKQIIERIAKENVDINALGLYTLGSIRKSVRSKYNFKKYQELFEKYFFKNFDI